MLFPEAEYLLRAILRGINHEFKTLYYLSGGLRDKELPGLLMSFLRVNNIVVAAGNHTILHKVQFQIEKGEKLAIAGETGSGKSSLLKVIAGLLHPNSGTVEFESKKVEGPFEKLVPGHREIGYLSQHFELRNSYRVEEVLSYSNELEHYEAERLFRICRIDHLLKRRTDEVSGGERQRISLAKLLASSPRLLLLDEPFSNLDKIHKAILKTVIQEVESKLGITTIIVSHDPEDLLPWADRILIMRAGRIIQDDHPESVYNRPLDEHVAALFGPYNKLSNSLSRKLLGVAGINPHGKVFVRPEKVMITSNEPGTPATVRECLFLGSHFLLRVELKDEMLMIYSPRFYREGDILSIKIATGDLWFLD